MDVIDLREQRLLDIWKNRGLGLMLDPPCIFIDKPNKITKTIYNWTLFSSNDEYVVLLNTEITSDRLFSRDERVDYLKNNDKMILREVERRLINPEKYYTPNLI